MQDWKEIAHKWSTGHQVWSVELGGIGPGYEQTIQILLFEIMARWEGIPNWTLNGNLLPEEYNRHVDIVVSNLDKIVGGFSGAQVGAASHTAFQFMHYGYNHMMSKVDLDRKILVGKNYPVMSGF